MKLSSAPIPTRLFELHEPIAPFVWEHVQSVLKPRGILSVTSKLFSLAEGRSVDRQTKSKTEWIESESDQVLGKTIHDVVLTIRSGVLLPSAGIDESNSPEGGYLLLPQNPFSSLKALHEQLTVWAGFSDFGLIMTDSRSQPLRQGVNGLALAHFGFEPVRNQKGTPDLYGRNLKVTSINDADAIAAVSVMLMGESSERTPLCWTDTDWIRFGSFGKPEEIQIAWKEDLYGALFSQQAPGAKSYSRRQ